jgi:hypothetical protein
MYDFIETKKNSWRYGCQSTVVCASGVGANQLIEDISPVSWRDDYRR